MNPTPNIRVSANAGLIDGLQAAGRLAVVVVGFVTATLGLLQAKDIAGLIAYIQANGGEFVGAVAGLIAFGTAAYGVFKSHKRGAQVANVAASPEVPDHVAALK